LFNIDSSSFRLPRSFYSLAGQKSVPRDLMGLTALSRPYAALSRLTYFLFYQLIFITKFCTDSCLTLELVYILCLLLHIG